MNIRTNLRNWRDDATYCIIIEKAGHIIKAKLDAITIGPWSKLTIGGMAERLRKNTNAQYYMIRHNKAAGITTPQKAIEEAVRRFEFDKTQAQGI